MEATTDRYCSVTERGGGGEKMEVAVLPMSPAAMSLTISSNHPSAYLSAPTSPRRFGHPSHCFYGASAPASPSRASAAIFQDLSNWEDEDEDEEEEEEKKHEKSATGDHGDDIDWEPFDFANGFSGQLDKDGRPAIPDLATADELFERGMIRPLILQAGTGKEYEPTGRGRALGGSISNAVSSRSRRASRSLSPVRGGGAEKEYLLASAAALQSTDASPDPFLVKGGGGSKKWKLMNMFLFRSASEGRATGRGSKDPLRRFSIPCSSSSSSSSSFLPSLFRKKRKAAVQEDASNAGARPVGAAKGRRTPTASVHATHLAASRAASEEMKKKAPLPYHPNALFGYLRHNAAIQSISRQFISSS